MTAQVLSLGDRGLDLVLGGGLRWVERLPEKFGAAVVIRGPAGSGKTVFATHAALQLAKSLGGPAVYACVELLPQELREQIAGIFGEESVKSIVTKHLRFEDATALGDALERLRSELTDSKLNPRVLVIDSLIAGYGLGAEVRREIADAVCKLAAKWGVALVLVEEANADAPPSPWVYASDTVIELSTLTEDVNAAQPAPFERRFVVAKHRFGPSDAGPHRFAIEKGRGIVGFPRPSAWLESWALEEVRRTLPQGRAPEIVSDEMKQISRADGPVLMVHGPVFEDVIRVARSMGTKPVAATMEVSLTSFALARPVGERYAIGLGNPYLSPHRMLRTLLDSVRDIASDATRPVLMRIGDLSAMSSMWNSDGLIRALGTFCTVARAVGFYVIMYETSIPRVGWITTQALPAAFLAPGVAPPAAAAFADTVIERFERSMQNAVLPEYRIERRR